MAMVILQRASVNCRDIALACWSNGRGVTHVFRRAHLVFILLVDRILLLMHSAKRPCGDGEQQSYC